jgi:hypothetical protein
MLSRCIRGGEDRLVWTLTGQAHCPPWQSSQPITVELRLGNISGGAGTQGGSGLLVAPVLKTTDDRWGLVGSRNLAGTLRTPYPSPILRVSATTSIFQPTSLIEAWTAQHRDRERNNASAGQLQPSHHPLTSAWRCTELHRSFLSGKAVLRRDTHRVPCHSATYGPFLHTSSEVAASGGGALTITLESLAVTAQSRAEYVARIPRAAVRGGAGFSELLLHLGSSYVSFQPLILQPTANPSNRVSPKAHVSLVPFGSRVESVRRLPPVVARQLSTSPPRCRESHLPARYTCTATSQNPERAIPGRSFAC